MLRTYLFQTTLCMSALLMALPGNSADIPVKVGAFGQDVATHFGVAQGLPDEDVIALRISGDTLYALTPSGTAAFRDGRFQTIEAEGMVAPTAEGEGDYVTIPDSAGRIRDLVYHGERILAAGPGGVFDLAHPEGPVLYPAAAHQVGVGPLDTLYIASENGLISLAIDGAQTSLNPVDDLGRIWGATGIHALAVLDDGDVWVGCPAGAARYDGEDWSTFTGDEGLPFNDFTSAAAGPEGVVWFGTTKGAIRFDGHDFDYRQGLRWLPGDEVRDVAVDGNGTAWFATNKGVGRIEAKPMTLAEKADFYEEEVEQYIKRTEHGYLSEVRLAEPGDKSEIIYTDSDNDGLWTSMYGAGVAFAYGATKDPKAKERATEAFEALRFLQTVTQGGEHSPPKGYVARTILPGDGPDPNEGRLERDIRHKEEQDYLWKLYEPRWPKSEDGKWYWKSDTSSDELDGHYFFYPLYYDLVAETEEEKERVREVVRDLTDHIIEHGFALMDHDGTVTRWAVYGPELLNFDREWWSERGLKSLSILSYLAVAEHITGDEKYGRIARELIDVHGYKNNAMIPKIQFGMGSGNQSDDEMAIMCFYNLMKYSKDEELKHDIRFSFYTNWILVQPETNPFFNFAYAAFGMDEDFRNPWGTWDISPWEGWLEDSIQTLKDFPLDRVNWAHQNAHRIDIQMLPRQQMNEPYIPGGSGRGYRKNTGKVISVAETHFNHWNADLWRLNTGGDGRTLASGTVYLLPYYMGLYHGFIED